jgi:hypothetical protein
MWSPSTYNCIESHINILLFFYRGESKAPLNINEAFTPIGIDYGKEVLGNYVLL